MPFSAEFWVGTAITFVIAFVGVAVGIAVDAKTKGEFGFVVGCFLTSAAIVIYGIGTWQMNTTFAAKYRISIALILFAGVAMGTTEAIRWAHARHVRAAESAKPPDNGRETVTLKDEVKAEVKPAPAINAELHKAPPASEKMGVEQPGRVMARLTPRQLTEIYDQHTTVEASKLGEFYIGTWLPVSGSVRDVWGTEQEPWMAIHLDGVTSVICSFRQEWYQRTVILQKGDPVKIIGKISKFDGLAIELRECEITN